MRKYFALLMMVMLCLSLYSSASALEITDSYIEQNGIVSVGDDGKKTIIIPLLTNLPLNQSESEAGVAPAHMLPEMPHTHSIRNVRSSIGLTKSEVLTEWADEGFTLSFSSGLSISIGLQISLSSGITTGDVESSLGIDVNSSINYTQETTYTAPTIPAGYQGRIMFSAKYDRYVFDDFVTYYPPGIPNYSHSETFADQVVEGDARDGLVYLQLREK